MHIFDGLLCSLEKELCSLHMLRLSASHVCSCERRWTDRPRWAIAGVNIASRIMQLRRCK
eukprot:3943274-Amphidinium_carterae.1